MRVLDLFSGIGGFSLGLERAGMTTVAFCEIEEYPRRVLRKHWPDVPIYEDIRELSGERLRADGIVADVVCGGFPCQDISISGAELGINGPQSGLWREFYRLVREIRPRHVIVENVGGLLANGLDAVLGDLAEGGYDAEWCVLSASFAGAPQARDRTWIIAYPDGAGLEGSQTFWHGMQSVPRTAPTEFGDKIIFSGDTWPAYPEDLRVGDGIPRQVDRIRSLGNAVAPEIPELIGRAIMAREEGR